MYVCIYMYVYVCMYVSVCLYFMYGYYVCVYVIHRRRRDFHVLYLSVYDVLCIYNMFFRAVALIQLSHTLSHELNQEFSHELSQAIRLSHAGPDLTKDVRAQPRCIMLEHNAHT